MSKKRTSTESNNDEQTTDDSGEAFRQVDNAKRGKFASFSDTTLQDIPTEILQCILVKAITMEVKNMKLAKSVWKEKAHLVIGRLGSVCSQWSSVLTTEFFRLELHRALNGIAQETIRMELLHESLVNGYVLRVTSLKDEMFLLCRHYHQDSMTSAWSYSSSIAVYDRNNMKEVKEVIALPGKRIGIMAACNVSNCVYVLDTNEELHSSSVLRIARNEEQKFNIQTWISDPRFPISSCSLCISDKGNLIIISRPGRSSSYVVWVYMYNANGFLQHEIMLTPETHGFICIESNAIQKSNGNLVLALVNSEFQMVLTEIDTDGIIQRQRRPTSSLQRPIAMDFADTSGRILIHDDEDRIELYDSELNLLEFTYPRSDQHSFEYTDIHNLHFNSERNEVLALYELDDYDEEDDVSLLRIFRLREE